MKNEEAKSRKAFYHFRLSDPDSHPESLWMVTWKDLGLGYLNTNSTHGLNPAISRAVGAFKNVFWIVLFLGALTGLGLHFYTLTSTFIAYDVLVKTTLSHFTEMKFPAVTMCNMNPVKSSLLVNNPRLQALVNSWGHNRKKRDINSVDNPTRNRRTTSLPSVTECPSDSNLRYGEYCYTVHTDHDNHDDAQARCEVDGGNLVWYESEQEHDVITQLYCHVESCGGNEKFWTGLYDSVGDDNVADHIFTWGGTPTYFNWGDDEPSTESHLCISEKLDNTWIWNDESCNSNRDFICKYRVDEQTASESSESQVTACEDSTASLACSGGTTIHILSVFYGRSDNAICSDGGDDDDSSGACECDPTDDCSISVVEACETMTSCDVDATTAFIGTDPCNSVSNYLSITYSCWTLDSTSTTTSTTQTTTATTQPTTSTTQTTATTTQPTTSTTQTTATTTQPTTSTTQTTTTTTQTAQPTTSTTQTTSTSTQPTTSTTQTTTSTTQTTTSTTEPTTSTTPTTTSTTQTTTSTTQTTTSTTETTTVSAPTTPLTTEILNDPEPAQESVYEDRDPYREDFLQQNDFFRVLADLSVEEKQELGYNLTDVVADCFIFGQRCNIDVERQDQDAGHRRPRSTNQQELMDLDQDAGHRRPRSTNQQELMDLDQDAGHRRPRSTNQQELMDGLKFSQFFDGTHGNCYIFNSGWDMGGILQTSETGRESGLRLVLKLGQEDYLPNIGEAAGVVVVVHPQDRFPFPEDEGFLALPGHINSIGVREIVVNRLGGRYGNCTATTKSQKDINIFEEWFPETGYSTTACFKTCYQKYVIKRCGCADPMYPMTGKALGVKNMTACDARDVTQDDCVYGVTLDYIEGKLDCSCHNPCTDKWYEYLPSRSMWPTEAEVETFLANNAEDIANYENFTTDPEFFRRNFLVVEVFFESLQRQHLEEVPKYKIEKYIADIGGTVGLWIGLTLLSLAEFLELFVDMLVLACTKLVHVNRAKNNSGRTSVTPIKKDRSGSFASIDVRDYGPSKGNKTNLKTHSGEGTVSNVNMVEWD